MLTRGKFIVIEGIDGSGKSVQFNKLVEYLDSKGHEITPFDFPQYNEPSSYFVKEYLAGHYGPSKEVGPYRASLFYALDRFAAKEKLNIALDSGKLVVSNRYVASNMGHQGANLKDGNEREKLFLWINEIEFKILTIPEPDLNIVLHVPAEISYRLIKEREEKGERGGAKRDIHELDLDHLKAAEESYLLAAKLFPSRFHLIECAPQGQLMTIDEIQVKIRAKVEEVISKN
ncbi:MAG: thymidylate kinase [Candidatus Paceibacterota bacterium]|jgi:dTMP kinase